MKGLTFKPAAGSYVQYDNRKVFLIVCYNENIATIMDIKTGEIDTIIVLFADGAFNDLLTVVG